MSPELSSPPSFASPPGRVVSLSPALTETLIDLGLGRTLVGVSDALEGLPRVDPQAQDAASRVNALEPDLVLVSGWPAAPAQSAPLDDVGAPVWRLEPSTVRAAIDMLWEIVRLFDSPQSGLRISALETTLEWTTMASYSRETVRTCCLLERIQNGGETWLTVGSNMYTTDLVATCGGRNVFAQEKGAGALQVDAQRVRAAEPAVVLLAVAGDEAPDPATLPGMTGLEDMAVARFHAVDRATLAWPGTRLAHALQDLPPLLQPDTVGNPLL